MFKLPKYIEPDFTQEKFVNAPNAKLVGAPVDKAAPENFHATSIYPEYFKIDGKWLLAEDSRMDSVPVYENGKITGVTISPENTSVPKGGQRQFTATVI